MNVKAGGCDAPGGGDNVWKQMLEGRTKEAFGVHRFETALPFHVFSSLVNASRASRIPGPVRSRTHSGGGR
jgi:hypothetical protein